MEELIKTQNQRGLSIQKLYSNFKKDGPSRRTTTYLQGRIERLEHEWAAFEHDDIALSSFKADNPKQNYFEKNYYSQVESIYHEYKKAILQAFDTSEATSSASKTPGSDVQKYINQQQAAIASLNVLLGTVKRTITTSQSQAYYQQHITSIRDLWTIISSLHLSIMAEEDKAGYEPGPYHELQLSAQQTLILLQEKLEQPAPSTPSNATNMKLPKIKLPNFDGNYLKWKEFHDLYTHLIHQQAISPSEKMYYLKAHLTGEASKIIQHLQVSAENYSSAWQLLEDRYNNKRLLASALLNKLLGQPTISNESANSLKRLHDVSKECLSGLQNLGIRTKEWDPLLVHLLLQKLDKESHKMYEQSLEAPKELPPLEHLLSYLEHRFQILESITAPKQHNVSQKLTHNKTTLVATKMSIGCPLCKTTAHLIYTCPKFLNMVPADRIKAIRSLHRCINCLRPGHGAQKCMSQHCTKCNSYHNTLLHIEQNKHKSVGSSPATTAQPTTIQNKVASLTAHTAQKIPSNHVFLGTAVVTILNHENQPIKARALLDSGSQVNFLTERLQKRLNLEGDLTTIAITGIGNGRMKIQQRLNVVLQSTVTGYSTRLEAFIIPKITAVQPSTYIPIDTWTIPRNIQLADPEFNQPQDIDLLIGAEFYPELLSIGQIKIGPNLPSLQNTLLGWVVMGKSSVQKIQPSTFCGVSMYEGETLDEQVKKFWTMEEVPNASTSTRLTTIEQKCENQFKTFTKRTCSGRYIVALPFLQEPSLLGDSLQLAIRRFLSLERRLTKHPDIKQQYIKFMDEYLALDHMTEITDIDTKQPHYFLPHHCVLRPESSSTKLRVVFDGSAKSTTNVALNDILHTGPALQNNLFSILVRFRTHRYVFTSDITQMYRQILLDNCDRRFQLIVWRNSPTDPLRYYQLNTVTYGTRSAPYLAIRCLHDLADIEAGRYPLGTRTLKQDFYVDDVLSGSDDLNTAIRIRNELMQVLAQGGFTLHKWCANTSQLLEGIPKEDREKETIIGDSIEGQVKTLGLTWTPLSDQLMIKTTWTNPTRVTKRTILSDLAHIFDPLGIVSPVVVLAKMFIQELWTLQLDWDASLPAELHSKWLKFRSELQTLNELRIPRHMSISFATNIQLHAFADASERAYGAVIYMRSQNQQGVTNVHLVCAKSKVAPKKVVTIPRLELAAAKLMVELTKTVIEALPIKVNETVYWTDSQIVLSWLHTELPLQTFVANRVAFIQDETRLEQWRHISSIDNPADILSRGAYPVQLLESLTWFRGPIFLQSAESLWPYTQSIRSPTSIPETKQLKTVLTTAANHNSSFIEEINHHNSFRTLQHIIARVLRFTHNVRTNKENRKLSTALTPQELQNALVTLVKHVQQSAFNDELNLIRKTKAPRIGGPLHNLAPFIDNDGILRVGGRLQASHLPNNAKHPMVLPSSHSISKLLLTQLHLDNLHAGPQALLATSRQKFWILRGKQLAQSVVHHCITCFKAKPKSIEQLMGNLPKERVQPTRPFSNVGIDFFGPLQIHYRIRGKQPTKAYVAVFVCFVTKATHFEVVSDLTTSAFIGALKRFVARRGVPTKIFSDNATNFMGARNELQDLHALLNSSENQADISQFCSTKGIEWHPIPARSPHFGGLWEAAVKSAKYHLLRVLKGASLTQEELTTVMAQIEAILNSRPLTPLSPDPNDLEVLTPGHFLIGEALTAMPELNAKPENLSLLARWNLVQAIHREFWRRWSKEYLQELQNRYKWQKSAKNIPPGTLVLLKEDNLPPLKWRLGRVTETVLGPDELTRVVKIKTSTGESSRSIHRVCPLPIESDLSSSMESNEQPSADEHRLSQPTSRTRGKQPVKHPLKGRFLPISNGASLVSQGISNQEIPPSSGTKRKLDSKESSQQRRTGVRINSVLPIALLVVLSLGTGKCDNIKPVEVTQFTHKPGIYFEEIGQLNMINHEWHIIAYFNMTSYWDEYLGICTCMENLRQISNTAKGRERVLHMAILQHLEQNLKDITYLNDILTHRNGLHSRQRRSPFDFVGKVSNTLFGILDQDYAQQMEETITKVKRNEDHLLNLVKNQTSIVESTLNIFNKSTTDIRRQFDIFDQQLSQLTNVINDINAVLNDSQKIQLLNSLAMYASLMMTSFQRTQMAALDVLTDTHQGRVNPLLITPTQLQRELTTIHKHLPMKLVIPGHDNGDLLKLYELLRAKARVTTNNIIFDIQLPLLSNDKFQIFKLIPLPTAYNNSFIFIEPSTTFLAITPYRDQYFPMSREDLQDCTIINEQQYICRQRHPIFNSHSTEHHCEVYLLNHHEELSPYCKLKGTTSGTIWIQLHHPNHWIFSLDREHIFNIVCGSIVINQRLEGEGLLKLQPNCAIRQPTMTIVAHNTYSSNHSISFIPTINVTTAVKQSPSFSPAITERHNLLFRGDEDIKELLASIQNLKPELVLPEDISTHDLHQYVLGYSTVVVVIVLVLLYKLQQYWKVSSPPPTIEPMFELQDLNAGEDDEA